MKKTTIVLIITIYLLFVNYEYIQNASHIQTSPLLLNSPVNVSAVKKKYEGLTTSTILDISSSRHFYKPDSIGFYGLYILIGDVKNTKTSFVGKLTVFNNENTWYYNNNSDVFIELVLDDSDLYVYENINIGTDVSILEKKFGNPNLILSNHYVYFNNNTIAIFEIIEEKIKWIKIGHYSEETVKNIKQNIEELVKH